MTYQAIKKIYPNHNKGWKKEEREFLVKAKETGKKWDVVGNYLGRKPSSCSIEYSRLKRENLLSSFTTVKKETVAIKKEETPFVLKKRKVVILSGETTINIEQANADISVEKDTVTIKMK